MIKNWKPRNTWSIWLQCESRKIGIFYSNFQVFWAVEILSTNPWNCNTSKVFAVVKPGWGHKWHARNWKNNVRTENVILLNFLLYAFPCSTNFFTHMYVFVTFSTIGALWILMEKSGDSSKFNKVIHFENLSVGTCWREFNVAEKWPRQKKFERAVKFSTALALKDRMGKPDMAETLTKTDTVLNI